MPYRARLPCAGDPRGSGWRAVRWRAWIEACTAPFGWSTRPPTTRPRLCGSRHTLQRVRDDLDRYSDPETAQNRPFWWVFGGDLTGSAPPREPPDRVIQPSDSYHESDWNHRPGVWPPIRENATATTGDAQRFVTLRDRIGPRPRPMGGFQLPPPSPQMPACRGGQPTGPGNTPAGATRERPGRTRRSASETSSPTTTWSSARAADLQRGRSVTAGRRSPGRRPAAGAGDPPGNAGSGHRPVPADDRRGSTSCRNTVPGGRTDRLYAGRRPGRRRLRGRPVRAGRNERIALSACASTAVRGGSPEARRTLRLGRASRSPPQAGPGPLIRWTRRSRPALTTGGRPLIWAYRA